MIQFMIHFNQELQLQFISFVLNFIHIHISRWATTGCTNCRHILYRVVDTVVVVVEQWVEWPEQLVVAVAVRSGLSVLSGLV